MRDLGGLSGDELISYSIRNRVPIVRTVSQAVKMAVCEADQRLNERRLL